MMGTSVQVQHVLNIVGDTFGVFVTDADGKIKYVNNYLSEITGYPIDHFMNESYHQIHLQALGERRGLKEIFAEEGFWKGEMVYETKGNEDKTLFVIVMPVENTRRDESFYITLVADMTEYAMLEEVAKTGKENLTSLMNITHALNEASIVAITDEKGVIQHVNDKFCEISQYDRSELIGKTHRVINSKYHPKSFIRNMWETILAGEVWNGEVKNRAKDGSYYWMNTTIVPFLNEDGEIKQFISIRTDITQRIRVEEELARVMEDDFKKVVQNLQNWVFKIKLENNRMVVVLSEGLLAEQFGILTDVVRGQEVQEVFSDDIDSIMVHFKSAAEGNKVHVTTPYKEYFIDLMLTPVKSGGTITEIVGSITDITASKKAEDTIRRMANYDSLTNLANRTHFTNKLMNELQKAEKNDENLAVMYIDLDRFKNINDSLGHYMGDRILQRIANYLSATVRKGDVVSRQGGDEFTILLPNTCREEAKNVAERILETLASPIVLDNLELYITPSIGVSMFPEDGQTTVDLIKNADAAMYLAKKNGRNNFQFYSKALHESILTRLEIETDLRKAMEEGEFELYYQAKVDIIEHKITGAEALIRWNHPVKGLIPPNDFIPIAEETGLIIDIGEWVLETACAQAVKWHQAGYEDMSIAVNISLRQFLRNNLHEVVQNVLDKTGLAPEFLELEITESMTSDAQYTIDTLNKIKALGVTISIDDFGTGYSSFSYLSQFPVDKLKIDQSFVRDLNATNQSIVKAIIDVAHNLGIDVIAEGVEERQQLDFLIEQSCTEAQGYFFSKPVPTSEMATVLNEF